MRLMHMVTEDELHTNLTRYYHLTSIFEKMLVAIDTAFANDERWFLYSVKIAKKLLAHCKSLCFNSADAFILNNGIEVREEQYIDITGLFINIRTQSDTYAILYHLFFDNADWEMKRLRFDLWRLDSLVAWIRQPNSLDQNLEKEKIAEIIESICLNEEYQRLDTSERGFVFKSNDDIEKIFANWKFLPQRLNTKQESKISWKQIFLNSGLKGTVFQNAHSFFSMYVHSNFFSVNHLHNLSQQQAILDKNFAIIYSSFLISLTIDDFCDKFEVGKEFVNQLPSGDVAIIRSFLHAAREKEKIKVFV